MRKILKPASAPLLSKMLISLSFFVFFSTTVYCQTVSGIIADANNQPLTGVTVAVKNTSRATVTNDAGRFQINAGRNDVLVVSSVGFTTQEVAVDGRNSLTISLASGTKNLDEVVVTALGINKQARSLGYAATTVKPDELTVNRTPNLMNALQGKVAGVNISGLGTGPAGTSKIRIRGQPPRLLCLPTSFYAGHAALS